MSISRDEWLAALGEAAKPLDPDALTCREIAKLYGIGQQTALRRVTALVSEGRAVRTYKMHEGRRLPAYRLVTPAKGKRAA